MATVQAPGSNAKADGSNDRASRRRRANGEGSIYQAASDGRWRGAITWTDADGRPQRKVVSGKTQAEVRRRLTDLRQGLDRGMTPAATTTLTDYLGTAEQLGKDGQATRPLSGWLRTQRQRVRPATWRHREQVIRLYLVPQLGRTRLDRLTPADVERMTAALIAGGRSARTASHARVVLRVALQDAMRDGLVHRNVAALAKPPRVEDHGLRHLDPAQLRTLLAACEPPKPTPDDPTPKPAHPLGPLFILAATTGLRQGELLGLTWAAVDLPGGRLEVRQAMARDWRGGHALAAPKTTRSRRTVHLPAAALAALRRQDAAQAAARDAAGTAWQDDQGLVFTDGLGRPLRGDSVNASFHRLLTAAGLPAVPFHALRHTAATALLAAGVPLQVVADQLGHSTIVLTANLYGHVVPESRSEAAAAMDRVLGG